MKRKIVMMVASVMLFGIASSSHAYNTYNGHNYDIVLGDWSTAEANAIALGGHLVTFNDGAEENWVKAIFGTGVHYWIGMNDIATEGSWVWSSGEPVTYTNWSGGEPNNAGNEDWAAMNWGYGWNDWCHWCSNQGIAEWSNAPAPAPAPEPGTLLLLGSGIAGLAAWRMRGRKRA